MLQQQFLNFAAGILERPSSHALAAAMANYLYLQRASGCHLGTYLCPLDLTSRNRGLKAVRAAQVTTVDKYQGQQNEYVLLSLVRTRAVGHVRDVRRLVVAMSRARLGLYIFGRLPLFANCYELQPTMAQLTQRPTQLALRPAEYWQVCADLHSPAVSSGVLCAG